MHPVEGMHSEFVLTYCASVCPDRPTSLPSSFVSCSWPYLLATPCAVAFLGAVAILEPAAAMHRRRKGAGWAEGRLPRPTLYSPFTPGFCLYCMHCALHFVRFPSGWLALLQHVGSLARTFVCCAVYVAAVFVAGYLSGLCCTHAGAATRSRTWRVVDICVARCSLCAWLKRFVGLYCCGSPGGVAAMQRRPRVACAGHSLRGEPTRRWWWLRQVDGLTGTTAAQAAGDFHALVAFRNQRGLLPSFLYTAPQRCARRRVLAKTFTRVGCCVRAARVAPFYGAAVVRTVCRGLLTQRGACEPAAACWADETLFVRIAYTAPWRQAAYNAKLPAVYCFSPCSTLLDV